MLQKIPGESLDNMPEPDLSDLVDGQPLATFGLDPSLEEAMAHPGAPDPDPDPESESESEPESHENDKPIEVDSELEYLSDPIDGGRFSGRLDLATTYVEMGMLEDAAELLGEVEAQGDESARNRAQELRQRIRDAQ
jgi:FimV-like protein